MALDIFSESANPRSSFKMDRRSPLAVRLKAAVNNKLIEFLGGYTDDILAEYVVVLVCNGKHQSQARDDLEAFLGVRSGEFVSWLWNLLILLLKKDDQSYLLVGSSSLKDVNATSDCRCNVDNEHGNHRLQGLQNHSAGDANELLSKDEKCCLLKSASKLSSNGMKFCKGFQHQLPTFDTSIDDIHVKDVWARSYEYGVAPRSGSVVDNHHEVLKYESSILKGSSNISAGIDQSMKYANQHEKIVSSHCNELPRQLLCSPNREPAPTNLQSVTTEKSSSVPIFLCNAAGKKFSTRAVDRDPQQDTQRRVSVWDRLGKPTKDNTFLRGEKFEVHGIDIFKRKILGDGELDQKRLKHFAPGSELDQINKGGRLIGEAPFPDDGCSFVKLKTDTNGYRRPGPGLKNKCSPPKETNSNRKRQFGEIGLASVNCSDSLGDSNDVNDQDIKTIEESQRLTYAKCSHSQSLNSVASVIGMTGGLDTYCASRYAECVCGPSSSKISRNKMNGEASKAVSTQDQVQNPSDCETETLNNEEALHTNLNPVEAQMQDVKVRLHQITMEISNLRSKQSRSINAKSLLSFSASVLSQLEEDAESRTVFVTNVHFAATKEALSLHFAECGLVVKVIILNDPLTSQPKGAAYITFASKDSAEKAVALNGVSFWSRNLKVVRKAEVHGMASAPAKLSGKSSRPESNRNRKVFIQRPFSGSNLRWRRDQTVDATNFIPANENEFEDDLMNPARRISVGQCTRCRHG